MRTTIHPDRFEEFLIKKTEQTLNTAFLWLLILKELNLRPQTAAELKKQIANKYQNIPHRTTFYAGVYLLQTMKLVQKIDDKQYGKRYDKRYEITLKGKLILERAIKHLHSNLAAILG